ncbi:MAG: CusA/CzcA family heavy metal efflux RND transporter [candidate division Zixibacteria bacterium]|nr:CusA/CzcA family heavy metal efflux RND transporter [candidate division Zixibacteria bacterium]
MLKRLIEFTIHQRLFVLCLAGLLVVAGLVALWKLPFDAFPDTTPVLVQVNVSAPGWAPEELERQVTFPLERRMAGLAGLAEVRSISKYGLSQVTLIFSDETNIYLARQQTAERLAGIELPDGVPPPQLGPISTGLGEIFHYVVVGKTAEPTELRTIQDWIIKPRLQSVPGVAEVNTWGGFEKQYHVLVDPNRLAQYNLTLSTVASKLRENLGNVPGGQMVRGGEQTLVRGVGIVSQRREIEELVMETRKGVPIRIRDLADVVIGHELRRGATTYDGKGEAVLGLGFMLTGQNPKEVTQKLAQRLDEIKSSLPEGVEVKPVYQRTDLVNHVLQTVEHNLFFGAVLVVGILFAFLGNLRAGLIVAASIPLSLLFAFDWMSRAGITGSLMSLGAIDFGLAVDNSVIQVENAVRRLSQANAASSRFDVIRDAILEVRKPTLFGELIIIIVYLPILTLQGVEGKLFRPMALTVTFVLTGSLLLSFTVIPALIAAFLGKNVRETEPKLVEGLKRLYRPMLDWALAHGRVVLASAASLLAAGILVFLFLGAEFVPRLSEGTIAINIVRLAGVSLEQSVDYGTRIEKILLEKFPDEIEHIWTRTGTAELATDPMGLELSDVFITLTSRKKWKKAENQQELVAAMDRELSDLPGANRIFTQPIEMRVNEMIAGIRADVGIKIFGDDLAALEQKAEEIARLAETIRGSADVSVEQLTGQPQLEIAVDRERLSRFVLSAREVLDVVESFGGIKVGEVHEGQRRFDLALRLNESYRRVPEDVERIPIKAATGELVTLDRVTKPNMVPGRSTITREWSKRRIVVQSNVRDRDVGSFVDELRQRIQKEIELPEGYFVRFGGQFENLERARSRLALVVPVALLLIFGLLYWTYKSVRDALLIFTGVPLAVVGGIAALAVRGMPFSISAGVGFIALSGVAVLNGLVLVSTIKRLRSEGLNLSAAVREGAESRLRPVLMTALVAAFGFIPMALSQGVGAEVQRPLATVVIGGILTSTALTLIVLPVLYTIFGTKTSSEQ